MIGGDVMIPADYRPINVRTGRAYRKRIRGILVSACELDGDFDGGRGPSCYWGTYAAWSEYGTGPRRGQRGVRVPQSRGRALILYHWSQLHRAPTHAEIHTEIERRRSPDGREETRQAREEAREQRARAKLLEGEATTRAAVAVTAEDDAWCFDGRF